MMIRFQTSHTHGEPIATWINPEQVAAVHTAAPEVATVYLIGGFEQRVVGRAEDVAGQIDEAQRALRVATPDR